MSLIHTQLLCWVIEHTLMIIIMDFCIADISNPTSPSLVGQLSIDPHNSVNLSVSDNYAYLATAFGPELLIFLLRLLQYWRHHIQPPLMRQEMRVMLP